MALQEKKRKERRLWRDNNENVWVKFHPTLKNGTPLIIPWVMELMSSFDFNLWLSL